MNKEPVHQQGKLGLQLVANMVAITQDRISDLALANAQANQAYIQQGRSLKQLVSEFNVPTDSAIIIAAGPSLRRNEVAKVLREEAYGGAVIATDSALRYCLENGITPSLVVTLDPHPNRIVRWFGDPALCEEDIAADDYFSRQDMDRAFSDQIRANEEIIALLDRHGKQIKIALSTSASSAVVKRAIQTGMQIYWWNPMLDDPEKPNSVTRRLYAMNGLPCLNAGGNVGTACWMIADAVLGCKRVALTGVDFSYYEDTPYENTQYYHEAVQLVGKENLDSLYIRLFNPYIQKWFYTDPAYMWYRQAFLEMVSDADCQTFNCTEGGILYGDGIEFVPLRKFLAMVLQRAST